MATNNETSEKRQLALLIKAARAGSDGLSKEESKDFDQMCDSHPGLRESLGALASELDEGEEEDCMEKSIRVVLNLGSPEEAAEVASWKQTSPRWWRNYKRLRFMLHVITESAKLAAESIRQGLRPAAQLHLQQEPRR